MDDQTKEPAILSAVIYTVMISSAAALGAMSYLSYILEYWWVMIISGVASSYIIIAENGAIDTLNDMRDE